MTTVVNETVRCAVCGHECDIQGIASSNQFGSVDLDTRPPEMMRGTITMWVHCCRQCGYCAPDLEAAADGTAGILKTPEYLAIRSRPGIPAKAREFLCLALIAAGTGRLDDAAWGAIHAAWICDDARAADAADQCRIDAVERIDAARTAAVPFVKAPGVAAAIRTDLLRRAGRFEDAGQCAADALKLETEDLLKKVLRFELMLIDRHDRECHTAAEATGPAR